jgi:hypothetical protein
VVVVVGAAVVVVVGASVVVVGAAVVVGCRRALKASSSRCPSAFEMTRTQRPLLHWSTKVASWATPLPLHREPALAVMQPERVAAIIANPAVTAVARPHLVRNMSLVLRRIAQ